MCEGWLSSPRNWVEAQVWQIWLIGGVNFTQGEMECHIIHELNAYYIINMNMNIIIINSNNNNR